MAEFLLELYSEEIPHGLQISAREEIKKNLLKLLEEQSIKYKSAEVYSTPTRLVLLLRDLPSEIKIEAKEVRGPKVGVPENIIEGFMKSHQITKKDIFEKTEDKGNFYYFKKAAKKILTEDVLTKLIPKVIASVNWKKSMRWSDHDLMWGRPLRSILAIFNNKHLKFNYHHLVSIDGIVIVDNFIDKIKKVKNFKEYESQLKVNKILLKQEDRKNNIIKKFQTICKSRSYLENFNEKLIEEVVNITENPSVILADFDKEYLSIPQEIIISTLQRHQRYFPLFDSKNRLKGEIKYQSEKTERITRVPLNRLTMSIFNKYSNGKGKEDYLFPRTNQGNSISNTKFNKHIKEICKEIGLNRGVKSPQYNLDRTTVKGTDISINLYEKVSSHIGRKSFIREQIETITISVLSRYPS